MTTNLTRRESLLALAAFACAPAFAADVPANSIYKLAASLTDQDGRTFELASLRGSPVIASMFYTSCDMVCPMIFETVHATLNALPQKARGEVKVLMVSFDPERDSVAVLKKTAEQRNCGPQWELARCDDATTRKVAALLGVQYRRISNGEYNHSSQLALLDREGRIVARTGKLGAADPAFVKRVAAA